MFDNARPSDIVTFLQRIDPTVLVNRTPIDAWREFLKKNNGGNGTINDMEVNWLAAKGSQGNGKGGHDQEQNYLSSKGFSGSKGDKIRAYLRGSATQ